MDYLELMEVLLLPSASIIGRSQDTSAGAGSRARGGGADADDANQGGGAEGGGGRGKSRSLPCPQLPPPTHSSPAKKKSKKRPGVKKVTPNKARPAAGEGTGHQRKRRGATRSAALTSPVPSPTKQVPADPAPAGKRTRKSRSRGLQGWFCSRVSCWSSRRLPAVPMGVA